MDKRKLFTFAPALAAVLLVVGAAAAAPRSGSRPAPADAAHSSSSAKRTATEAEDQGVHGGSVERFHAECAFPEGVGPLEGNWTHGDFVSAWARADGSDAVKTAAHSPCGKPISAADAQAGTHGRSDEPHGKSDEPHGKSGR